MSAFFEVLEPGMASSVQDRGRTGWLSVGVPPGGALDAEAHRLANALAENGPEAAALELRYVGPSLRLAADAARVALVGAEVSMRLERADGAEPETIGPWRTALLRRGDVLKVGPLRGSSTATLAVSGGIAVEPVLGARATFARGGFGGGSGRPLQAGDRLPLARAAAPDRPQERWIPPEARPAEPKPLAPGLWPIRATLGPQEDYFSEEELARFFTLDWTVSQSSDRMGLRLEGAVLEHAKGFNIVSDGIATGALQVPGTGQPILLLADRGTAGGYPKLGVAASVDLPLLGRLAPGAKLRFQRVSVAQAIAALRARDSVLAAAEQAIGPYHEPGSVDEARLLAGNIVTARVEIED